MLRLFFVLFCSGLNSFTMEWSNFCLDVVIQFFGCFSTLSAEMSPGSNFRCEEQRSDVGLRLYGPLQPLLYNTEDGFL